MDTKSAKYSNETITFHVIVDEDIGHTPQALSVSFGPTYSFPKEKVGGLRRL